MKEIHKQVFCDKCNKMIERQFRFTDWSNESNDVFGDFDCCLKWFKQAVKEEPKGRFSIYAVTVCDDCGTILEDEGVLSNKKCDCYE
ncbi:MAG: hypothetical protein ACOC1X_02065 [Promethearchaeota archaeon]